MKRKRSKGIALANLIFQEAQAKGICQFEIKNEAGMGYLFLADVKKGRTNFDKIGFDKLRRASVFLNMNFIEILQLAEIIDVNDFEFQK